MSDTTDKAAIEAALATPVSVSNDGTTVVNTSVESHISGQIHNRDITATSPRNIVATLRGMSLKIVPPGGL